MTSHDGSWGVLGNWSAPFSFFPKGALTHHLPAGQAVVLPRCVRRALCEAAGALCGERQPMLPRLRSRSSLSARRERYTSPSACKNLPPAASSQRQGQSCLAAPVSLLRKRNRKRRMRTNSDIPLGSEGHQQRRGSICLRSIGLYELFRHL